VEAESLTLQRVAPDVIACPACAARQYHHGLQVYKLAPPLPDGNGHFFFFAGLCTVTKTYLFRSCRGWAADGAPTASDVTTEFEDRYEAYEED